MDKLELKELLGELIDNNEIEFELEDNSSDANERVSEMSTVTPVLTTDFLPMVRNSSGTYSNNKVTVQSIIDVVPGGAASVLTEGATSQKISAMTDIVTLQTTDKLPVVRNVSGTETNFSTTVEEIIAAVPGGAPSILVEGSTSEKISAMSAPSSVLGTDVFPIVRDVSGTQTNYAPTIDQLIAALPATGSFDPFDAKATTFAEFQTAITAGKNFINLAASFNFTANVQLSINTYLFVSPSVSINQENYELDRAGNNLVIEGRVGATWLFAKTSAGGAIIDSVGQSKLSTSGVFYSNAGSAAATYLYERATTLFEAEKCVFSDNGEDDTGVAMTLGGSYIRDCTIIANAVNSNLVLSVETGSKAFNVIIDNQGNSTNVLAQVIDQGVIDTIQAINNPIKMICGGTLNNIVKGENIDITANSYAKITSGYVNNFTTEDANVVLQSLDFTGDILIENTAEVIIDGCYGGGTFTNNSTSSKFGANTGTIPSGGGTSSTSISFFDAEVDGVGTLTDHYATLEAAITASKSRIYISANISLAANITLSKETYIFVGQDVNVSWNGHQILTAGFVLRIDGVDYYNSKFTASSSNILPPISDSSGNNPLLLLNNICFDNSAITNNDCAIGASSCVVGDRVHVIPGNCTNSGLAIVSDIANEQVNALLTSSMVSCSGTLTNLVNAIYVNCGKVDDITLKIKGVPQTNVVFYIDSLSSVDNVNVFSDNGFTISCGGKLRNLVNNSGSAIDVICNNSTQTNNCTLENLELSTGNFDLNGQSYIDANNITLGTFSNATVTTGSNSMKNFKFSTLGSAPTLTITGSRYIIDTFIAMTGTTLDISGMSNYSINSRVSNINNSGAGNTYVTCVASAYNDTGSLTKTAACQGAFP